MTTVLVAYTRVVQFLIQWAHTKKVFKLQKKCDFISLINLVLWASYQQSNRSDYSVMGFALMVGKYTSWKV